MITTKAQLHALNKLQAQMLQEPLFLGTLWDKNIEERFPLQLTFAPLDPIYIVRKRWWNFGYIAQCWYEI